jgi:hypothetical protein
MPISIEQRLTLYRLARDHWLEAHGTLSAYDRDYRKNKTVSEWLRRGTLCTAIVTTASTASPWPPFTVISGALTAILAAAEQAYAPAKASQAFWDCRTQLEGIKKDIVTCVIAMDSATDLVAGIEPLNQIARRLTEGTKLPFAIEASDRETALKAFNDSVIAGMINRYGPEPEQDEELPAALGFDAPEIVMVARQSVPAGGG